MGNVIVGIHQPNFMPWLGYFYKIWKSDVFIFLDDVQFQKTGASYTNRVSININGESQYLTIPVKREPGTWNINQTKFIDQKWKKKIIGNLQANYAKSDYFKQNRDFIFSLIEFETNNLAEYNIKFIEEVSKKLEFNTKFVKSSTFNLSSMSTKRLIDLILLVSGNTYLSGSGGDNYQDKELYLKSNINLIYNKIPIFEYRQQKTDSFNNGLSVIDAIFNIGFDNLKRDLFHETN